MKYRSLYLKGRNLRLIDQTLLPTKVEYIECSSHFEICNAITNMQVRGISAINIAAAYGMALATDNLVKPNGADPSNWEEVLVELDRVRALLIDARPVDSLRWITSRMLNVAKEWSDTHVFDLVGLRGFMIQAANRIYEEDIVTCKNIGKFGATLINSGTQVLTHCNAGSLASAELGTALSSLYIANREGKKFSVYICETRPLFRGSRLTAWELQQADLDPIIVTDSCAAYLMKNNRVDVVIVGAHRVAKNGDVLNTIGSYGLAVLCKHHKIPFYVAAASNVIDFAIKSGEGFVIESRDWSEITEINKTKIAPPNINVYNPTVDVTPAELIKGIITDHGLITPVNEDEVEKCFVY